MQATQKFPTELLLKAQSVSLVFLDVDGVFTDGGLKVSLQHEVLHSSGAPIDGLYAAGSNGQGGVLLEGHGHHLAWAFISGRRAGEQALARARQHSPKQG